MMKKLIASVAVVGIMLAGVLGFSKTESVEKVQKQQEIKIVLDGDFYVLKGSVDGKGHSSIVAQVEDNDTDGDGYVTAINCFDNSDEVAINKMLLHKGDIVIITFTHDEVSKVQLNTLNIGGKVFGQNIK